MGPVDCRRHILPGKTGIDVCQKAERSEAVGKGRKGTGTHVLILMDGNQTPLGAVFSPANNHESRHIERLLDSPVVGLPAPCRLIGDVAADSDPLRERLAERKVELIAPHRKKSPTQDGRTLRRMKRARRRVERTNAWLQSDGRIAVRKDRLGILFLGWTQLACLFTFLKRF